MSSYDGTLLPAATLVREPGNARRVALMLASAFLFGVIAMIWAPWQQSVKGHGRVVAYAPLDRRQLVEAPLAGRVTAWFVQEGSRVSKGDLIVEIGDNDPAFLTRLRTEQEAVAERKGQLKERTVAIEGRLAALARQATGSIEASEASVLAAEQRVIASRRAVEAAETASRTAQLNLDRQRALLAKGLASGRQLELAELSATRARTSEDQSRASLLAAESDLAKARAELASTRASADAKVQDAEASLRSARGEVAKARVELQKIDTRIARQHTQRVTAPRDGVVLRVLAQQGGEQVKAGDPLLELVPDTQQVAVELWVDGNDAALVDRGRKVRLQFEGWPAVQFTGWPSVAVGTFGGVVDFVDAGDDGAGNFRVLVLPDPEDSAWPDSRYLRQGVRSNGWLLLEQVALGFEMWRQFNGFPPTVASPATASASGQKK